MAKRQKTMCYSGIGGQAVLEGVMMKNGEKYAVAVRKPDGEIDVETQNFHGVAHGSVLRKIPFVRGIFNFIDSLVLGMRSLNYSAAFYDEESEHEAKTGKDNVSESVMNVAVICLSVLLAVGLFIFLPTFLASILEKYVRNASLLSIIEGVLRLAIFLLYLLLISLMKDMRRLFRYHGAEHKCINCIERGRPLTVVNVMHSSRFHKRCGTSFLFLVMVISIILFFFIRTDNIALRMVYRILLVPVIAGISYEVLRLAGRSDNLFVRIISAPGMWFQRITTKEPDEKIVEVAIASVEAVFDWKYFQEDHFMNSQISEWDYEEEETEEHPGEDSEEPSGEGEAKLSETHDSSTDHESTAEESDGKESEEKEPEEAAGTTEEPQ